MQFRYKKGSPTLKKVITFESVVNVNRLNVRYQNMAEKM